MDPGLIMLQVYGYDIVANVTAPLGDEHEVVRPLEYFFSLIGIYKLLGETKSIRGPGLHFHKDQPILASYDEVYL